MSPVGAVASGAVLVGLVAGLTSAGGREAAPIEYSTRQVIAPEDSAAVAAEKAAKVLPRANQSAWMRLERTFFVHFGPNTFRGVEWGDGREDPSLFAPTALDADQWVRAMKDAGGRLVILVSKHHDGLCLWPTRYTTHSVAASPWLGGRGRRGPGRRRGRARPRYRAGGLSLARRPLPAADESHESRGLLRQRQCQGPLRHPHRSRELPDGSDPRARARRGLRQLQLRGRRLQPLLPQPALRAADRVRPDLRRVVRRCQSRPERAADLRLRRVVRPDPPPAAGCGHLGQGTRRPLGRQRRRHRPHHRMERHSAVAAARELHAGRTCREPTSAAARNSRPAPTSGGIPPR